MFLSFLSFSLFPILGCYKHEVSCHFYLDLKPPEQLSLMQQLQQQVPKHLIFPKSCIQLGSTVGQGKV